MKRYGNLFARIVDYENLWLAAKAASRGKRFREPVLSFNFELERNLLALQEKLCANTYEPGAYRTFIIHDPKKRLISAAPFRDRVVHHAVCQIIGPIFEQTYIHDCYANRVGKGSHRSLQRFKDFVRTNRYVLRCDIRKYFPSIDHTILKEKIRRKIKCSDTLRLMDTIINASNPQEPVCHYFPGDDLFTQMERRHGLPIGNLTSQHFANIYLNRFDHWVKESLGCKPYLRYMDDFALFGEDQAKLWDWKQKIEAFLDSERLRLHGVKTQVHATSKGSEFVGFRVFPTHTRLTARSLRRARRRIAELREAYGRWEVDLPRVHNSIQSWIAHLMYGNTHQLRSCLCKAWIFRRGTEGAAFG